MISRLNHVNVFVLDQGSLGGGVFETADCQKTFEELSAERRHVPPGTSRAAIRDRSALPRRLRQLVQPHAAQVARAVNVDPGSPGAPLGFLRCAGRSG